MGARVDEFDEGNILNCKYFMNKAVIEYNKIVCVSGQFQCSITTIQENIVAMVGQKQKEIKRKTDQYETSTEIPRFIKHKPLSFVTHYQNSHGVKYKIGDTLNSNGTSFHFCDCPLHRNKLKWYTHHSDKSRIRNFWLKENGYLGWSNRYQY